MKAQLLAIVVVSTLSCVWALDNGLARTPPMGWSTWNTFKCAVNETLVRQAADAMVSTGLNKVGYVYVNIDDCWAGPGRDANGNIYPDPVKFPSGMKALGDYIHGKGLLFGLYSSSGPYTCANYTGSWAHEAQDAETMASWGVDFFKLDCCYQDTIENRTIAFDAWSAGLNATGRPIVYSCDSDELILKSGNQEFPWLWGPSKCNMARIWWDIHDYWDSTIGEIDHTANVAYASQPGFWVDMDIMTVGMGGQTTEEYKTIFSIWAIVGSPLIMGNDIRSMDSVTFDILTNTEVIAVNQDPLGMPGNRYITHNSGSSEIWARPIRDANTQAVVLFNRSWLPTVMVLNFSDLFGNFLCCPPPPPTPRAFLRDLWAHKDLGNFTEYFITEVPAHGVVMLTVQHLNPT